MSTLVAVTGATGHVGSQTARLLADSSVPVRLVVRDASRAPDLPHAEVVTIDSYADTDGCQAAFTGVDTLFLVSAGESEDRVAQHRSAIDAAAAAGVRQIVYLSFVGAGADAPFTLARDHGATEDAVTESGLAHTFLRDNFYTEAVRGMFRDDGVIRGPAGRGRVACVSQADVAAVAATVLQNPRGHEGRTYTLTGPDALDLATIAAIYSEVSGTPHRYVDETMDEARASRAPYGAPDWMVDAWISTYTAIRDGALETVSPHVPELLGRPALSVGEVFRGYR